MRLWISLGWRTSPFLLLFFLTSEVKDYFLLYCLFSGILTVLFSGTLNLKMSWSVSVSCVRTLQTKKTQADKPCRCWLQYVLHLNVCPQHYLMLCKWEPADIYCPDGFIWLLSTDYLLVIQRTLILHLSCWKYILLYSPYSIVLLHLPVLVFFHLEMHNLFPLWQLITSFPPVLPWREKTPVLKKWCMQSAPPLHPYLSQVSVGHLDLHCRSEVCLWWYRSVKFSMSRQFFFSIASTFVCLFLWNVSCLSQHTSVSPELSDLIGVSGTGFH